MKYQQAFCQLGANYKVRPAYAPKQRIFSFWHSESGGGDEWATNGQYITVRRSINHNNPQEWSNRQCGESFYKSLIEAHKENLDVKVVKTHRNKQGRLISATPMMVDGLPMLGRVIIEPAGATQPNKINRISIQLRPQKTEPTYAKVERSMLRILKSNGAPALIRKIREDNIIIDYHEVPWVHSMLTFRLVEFLRIEYSDDTIIVENGLQGARADVIRVRNNNNLHIYEVKTSTDRAKCERASIGQLLEYASTLKSLGYRIASINTVGINSGDEWVGRKTVGNISRIWNYIPIAV